MFMAKKDDSAVDKAAQKVANAEKKAKIKQSKPKKGNIFPRMGKTIKKFWKDFRGELKKIIWPDSRSVVKNTGIVLGMVVVFGIVIYLIDQGLSIGVSQLFKLAGKINTPEDAAAMMQAMSFFVN